MRAFHVALSYEQHVIQVYGMIHAVHQVLHRGFWVCRSRGMTSVDPLASRILRKMFHQPKTEVEHTPETALHSPWDV